MQFANVGGRAHLLGGERGIDIASASGGRFGPDPMALFDRWDELVDWASTADPYNGDVIDTVRCGAPVPRPRQVFAVASNYSGRQTVVESSPELPAIFTKFPSSIVGPYGGLPLPTDTVDWEVELVVVLGQLTRAVSPARAWEMVAGVTVGQDFSERTLQLGGPAKQFSLGKSYPGFGPTGPVLVTPEELPDRDDLRLQCMVNGEIVQDDRTASMIFSVPELIARLSQVCELFPGDLIFTGTPGGMGMTRTPPRFLSVGDEVRSRIEGIGEICSICTVGAEFRSSTVSTPAALA